MNEEPLPMHFALKNYKERTGLSVRDIATDTGVSKSTISRILLNQTQTITPDTEEKLKGIFESFKNEIGEGDKTPIPKFENKMRSREPFTTVGEIYVWVPRETSGEVSQHTINVTNFPKMMSLEEEKAGIRYPKGYDYYETVHPEQIDDGEKRTIIYKTKYTLPLTKADVKRRLTALRSALTDFGVGKKQMLVKITEVRAILEPWRRDHYANERRTEQAVARFSTEEERAEVWDNRISDTAKKYVTREHFIETGSLGFYDPNLKTH